MILKQRYFTKANEAYIKKVAKHLGINPSQAMRLALTRAEQLKVMLKR